MNKIDIESREPLYIQMKEILKKRFIHNNIKSHIQLPTEMKLVKEYKVGRMVIQKAIQELRNEGYLYRRPKLGTFISQKNKKETLRIAYYDDDPIPYSMKKIFSLFEKSHPNISIEMIKLPASEEYFKYVVDMISSNNVDIIKVTGSFFRAFDVHSLFYSLNSLVKQQKNNTYVEPWNVFKSVNTYYGFPIAFSPVVMCYNKDLFDKAGVSYPEDEWNWDDFLDKAKKLTLNKRDKTQSGQYGFLFSAGINRWPVFILQNGGRFLNDDGKGFNLTSAESREAISFIHDLLHKWKVTPVLADPAEVPQSLFLRSKIAMTIVSYYDFNILNKIKIFSWDVTSLPQKKCKATFLLADGFVVSKKTTNFNLCLEFLKFTQSPTIQNYIKSCKTLIPVNKDIAEKTQRGIPENYRIYKNVLPCAGILNLPYRSYQTEIVKEETNLLWHRLQSYEETCEHIRNRVKYKIKTV